MRASWIPCKRHDPMHETMQRLCVAQSGAVVVPRCRRARSWCCTAATCTSRGPTARPPAGMRTPCTSSTARPPGRRTTGAPAQRLHRRCGCWLHCALWGPSVGTALPWTSRGWFATKAQCRPSRVIEELHVASIMPCYRCSEITVFKVETEIVLWSWTQLLLWMLQHSLWMQGRMPRLLCC